MHARLKYRCFGYFEAEEELLKYNIPARNHKRKG